MSPVPLRVLADSAARRPSLPAQAAPHPPSPLPGAGEGEFDRDMRIALAERPHRISPKYFYDAAGSYLFDRICELPEYYPTRTELAILGEHAGAMALRMAPHAELVEFGAGSLQKAGLLLRAMRAPARFVPIDISGAHLQAAADALQRSLAAEQPQLRITPVVADYTADLPQPLPGHGPRYGFFPGSTIGNLMPDEAVRFLRRAAAHLRGGALLLGADLIKDPARLHAAYNDAAGVTAAFSRNVLVRANRELGADFAPDRYAHSAFYNAPLRRIEMHLLATRREQVRIGDRVYTLEEGETLHTENSYKFTIEGVHALARQAGLLPGPYWTDAQRQFAVFWLDAPDETVPDSEAPPGHIHRL